MSSGSALALRAQRWLLLGRRRSSSRRSRRRRERRPRTRGGCDGGRRNAGTTPGGRHRAHGRRGAPRSGLRRSRRSPRARDAAPLCPHHGDRLAALCLYHGCRLAALRAARPCGSPGASLGGAALRRCLLVLVVFVRPPCALPRLAGARRALARPPGLALGFLQTLTGTLQLVLGEAHALLGHVGLQSRSFKWLPGRAAGFASGLFHAGIGLRSGKKRQSHTSAGWLPPRQFIHRICA